MSCANFQELLAGQGAATATDFTPANIDFPYDSNDDLRLDIYNYQDQVWVNVPLATGATIDVGGAGDVFYAWETYLTNGQTGVRTILATAGTTPPLPGGGTASHPLAPANNTYPVQGGVGVNVRLYRQTAIDAGELPAYFYPGASIRAQDLNDNFEALRKVVEESACSTNNITDGTAQLDARYWNKVLRANGGDTIPAADVPANWQSDDNHIATTAAGDARWLNATGGNVQGRDMITATETGGNVILDVDLAATSGLESTNPGNAAGELRINVNDGCEIVAAGLNAETTDASIIQTGGTNADPAIRIRKTLGTATTDDDLAIVGGGGINVSRDSNSQLTISAVAGQGGLSFEGTVNVAVAPTNVILNADRSQAWTVEAQVAAADVHADWDIIITNWDDGDGNPINAGDVLACTADGDGDAIAGDGANNPVRFERIASGGGFGTLQQVTNNGSSTTNDITFQTGANVNTQISGDGSAVFNEQGANVDFRVERQGGDAILVDADTIGNSDQTVQLDSTAIINTDADKGAGNNRQEATLTVGQAADATGTNHFGVKYGNTVEDNQMGADTYVSNGAYRVRVNGAGAGNNTDTIDFINGFADNIADVSIRPDDSSILLSRTKYRETGGGANFLQIGVNGAMANDITWNLPTGLPADNQILKVDGAPAGNVVNLAWEADTGGGGNGNGGVINDVQVARIVDQKAANTAGGASVAGWQVRTLNTEVYDDDSIVALSGTNGFTLAAGEYLIEWSAPAFRADSHQTALSTTTNAANIVAVGSSEFTDDADQTQTISSGSHRVTAAAGRTYHILHNVSTAKAANGLGVAANAGQPEIYTQVTITNLAGVTVNAAGDVNHITYNGAAAWGTVDRPDDATATLEGGLNCTVSTTVQPDGTVVAAAAGVSYVTFTNPMPNANYSVVGQTTTTGILNFYVSAKTAQGFTAITQFKDDQQTSNAQNRDYQFAVFALNALPPQGGTGTDAWGNFSGRTTNGVCTENGSFRIASMTRTDTGQYTVAFGAGQEMPDANYSVQLTALHDSRAAYSQVEEQRADGFDLYVNDSSGTLFDPFRIYITVNATNATLPLTITEDQIAALIQNPVLSAWAHVDMDANGTNIQVNGGFNVREVTRSAEGNFTVVFDNDIPGNYSVTCTSMEAGGVTTVQNTTAANCQILMRTTAGAAFDGGFYIQVAGTARNGTLGGGADAWGAIAQNGDLEGTFNVDEVVLNDAGEYTVSFINSMPNTNYSVVATPRTGGTRFLGVNNKTVNGFDVVTFNDSNVSTSSPFSFAVFATDGNAGGFWQSTGVQGSANQVLSPLNDDAAVEIGGGEIELNADGSAEFAGNTTFGNYDSAANPASQGVLIAPAAGFIGISTTDTGNALADNKFRIRNTNGDAVTMFADGSAEFAGTINVNGTGAASISLANTGACRWTNNAGNSDGRLTYINNGNVRIELENTSGQTRLRLEGAGIGQKPGGGSWSDIDSERRLKQNMKLVDPVAAWETIKTLPYYSYQFISDPTFTCYGPVVDECPEDMQVIQYEDDGDGNRVVKADAEGPLRTYDNLLRDARLFVALQEALKRIEALEAKLNEKESN